MNVFLDANVLVSVINREYPHFPFCARVLSLAGNSKYSLYTSPLCLGIAWYFAEKKSGSLLARKKMEVLTKHLRITTINEQMAKKVVADARIKDFEDGLEYFSAIESKCKCIITQDRHDFYFSEIEVLKANEFLEKYIY